MFVCHPLQFTVRNVCSFLFLFRLATFFLHMSPHLNKTIYNGSSFFSPWSEYWCLWASTLCSFRWLRWLSFLKILWTKSIKQKMEMMPKNGIDLPCLKVCNHNYMLDGLWRLMRCICVLSYGDELLSQQRFDVYYESIWKTTSVGPVRWKKWVDTFGLLQ